jgi:hypothetical protein
MEEEMSDPMNENTQKDVLAHLQVRSDVPTPDCILVPDVCPICQTNSCDAVNQRFGVCPICHTTDGYLNVGNNHWFLCHTHKTKWAVGANLFSSCMDETPEQQRAEQEQIGFAQYRDVEPYRATGAQEVPDESVFYRPFRPAEPPDPQDNIHTRDQIVALLTVGAPSWMSDGKCSSLANRTDLWSYKDAVLVAENDIEEVRLELLDEREEKLCYTYSHFGDWDHRNYVAYLMWRKKDWRIARELVAKMWNMQNETAIHEYYDCPHFGFDPEEEWEKAADAIERDERFTSTEVDHEQLGSRSSETDR